MPDRGPRAEPHTVRRPALHGILITYRRPAAFRKILARLGEQTRPPDRLVVVDNDPSPEVEASLADYRSTGRQADYVGTPENLGPAGGIALGMREVLGFASDDDWAVLLDDDDPPEDPDLLGRLETFAHQVSNRDPRTAGVGVMGARFDWLRGRPAPVPDGDLEGVVVVDYVGGNKLPMYRVGVFREVGTFRDDLFFGFDDLEFGLRVKAAGYRLYVDGAAWRQRRARRGRLGADRVPSPVLDEPGWRRYYSLRNMIWILRSHGRDGTAARLALLAGVGKPLANVFLSPALARRHLALSWRACRDGWVGRMGRTVEPTGRA
jgi:glycosyltransferase involved in cell wall biosynthesis